MIWIVENPHFEHTKKLVTSDEESLTFCTFGLHDFKVWKIDSENNNFYCIFDGKYRNEIISSVVLFNDYIISLHNGKYLIRWDIKTKSLSNLYIFDEVEIDQSINNTWEMKINSNRNFLLIANEKHIKCFNIINFKLMWEENFDKIKIIPKSINFLNVNENQFFLIQQIKNTNLCMNFTINEKFYSIEEAYAIEKPNVVNIIPYKNNTNFIVINSCFNIFLTKKETLLSKKERNNSNLEIEEDKIIKKLKV